MMRMMKLSGLKNIFVGWGVNLSKTLNQNPMLGCAPQPTPRHSVGTTNLPLRRGGLGWRLFAFVFFIIATPAFAGNLTASVDRDTIGLSETLILTLRYDSQVNATPDYSLLQKDFEVLNTTSGRSMSIVNGHAESYTQWQISLAPRKIGKLLIPSFNINGDISDAIEINVGKQSSLAKATGSEPVSVEVTTDKDSVYAQEQIIFTVRLITHVSLNQAQMDPLSIPDTFVTELDEKNYKTNINGKPALIVEKRYAIFPLKAGTLTIPALRYQVAIDDGDIWSRMSGNNNIVRLMTDEKTVEVKAAPTDKTSWLPAEDLHISEHWSSDINNLKVGEPVSRTITVTAQGLTAAQIPPFPSHSIDGLTFYQDQAQTDDQKTKKGNQGSRIETTAIVPNKTGKFTLPETKIEWWNTKTQQYETASLPSVTLNVISGGELQTQVTNSNSSAPTNSETISDQSTDPTPDQAPITVNSVPVATPFWMYILLGITSLLSVFLFFAWWNLRQQFNTYINRKSQQEIESAKSESDAWNLVKTRLQNDQLIELRQAIIEWAKHYWKNADFNSLQDIAERAESSELKLAFIQLDASLFNNDGVNLDKQNLKNLLSNLRRGKIKKTAPKDKLQSLYRDV